MRATVTIVDVVSSPRKALLTPEQYLEIEAKAEGRSEYCHGEMFAMSGASLEHVLLVTNIGAEFGNQLRGRNCRVGMSALRVFVPKTGLYTYPDVVVYCGAPQLQKPSDTLTNPTVPVEVLSPSTEAYDRGRKFEHYRSIDSLKEYLLVSSDRVHADLYTRQQDGRWLLWSAGSLEESVKLESVDCQLKMADLYEAVIS